MLSQSATIVLMSFNRKNRLASTIGIAGVIVLTVFFILEPSFPTPDKLLIFLIFLFMIVNQTVDLVKHVLPFTAVILVYEAFRGIADNLNTHVNYTLAPNADKFLLDNLPTKYLQDWLWTGHTQWYDIALYIPYLLFFIMPFALAILIWKTREVFYWRAVTMYGLVFFAAFLTFLLFPAAPPWLAAQEQIIEPVTRISSYVWSSLGIQDFPSVYNAISPNAVAAIPSLHAAASTLFAILIFKLYGRKWGALAVVYPLLIYFGTVYEGEHYVFDLMVGAAYAVIAYLITPRLIAWSKSIWLKLRNSNNTKSA